MEFTNSHFQIVTLHKFSEYRESFILVLDLIPTFIMYPQSPVQVIWHQHMICFFFSIFNVIMLLICPFVVL